MQKYFNTVQNRDGVVQSGALITVTTLAGGAATIYSDNGITPITGQLLTDANGYFAFYAADGRYTVTVSGAGINSTTVTDVLLEDPADAPDSKYVDAITTVNASNLTNGAVIIAKGRSAAGDGGGGMFRYDSASTVTADAGIVFAPATGSGRFLRDGAVISGGVLTGFKSDIYAEYFGAKADGTDAGPALVNAISAAAGIGGADIWLLGTSYLSSMALTIQSKGIKLKGLGAGFYSTTSISPTTQIVYTGAAGADMLTVSSVSGSGNNKVTGVGVLGVALNGGGLAARGLVVRSVNNSTFDSAVKGCTSVQIEWNVVADLADARDPQHNDIRYLRAYATGTQNGILLTTDILGANISFNQFGYLYAAHTDGYGVKIGNCDNNVFRQIACSRAGGGTGKGIIFGAGNGVSFNKARANVIEQCAPGAGGIYSEGTPTNTDPAVDNIILYLDKENAAADPTIEAGSTLSWGSNKNVFGRFGYFNIGIGQNHTQAVNALGDALATGSSQVIFATDGKHQRFHNGSTGVWGWGVELSSGNPKLTKAGSAGNYVDYTGAVPIAPKTYTWSTKPAATLFPEGTSIVITDIGPADCEFVSDAAVWRPSGLVVLGSSAVATSHTGDINEFALATVVVPAGAMGLNGSVTIETTWSFTNSANTKSLRIRLGSISGTQILQSQPTTTSQLSDMRSLYNRNSASSQVVSRPLAPASAFTNQVASIVTATENTANDMNIVISGTLTNSGETITLESYRVLLYPG